MGAKVLSTSGNFLLWVFTSLVVTTALWMAVLGPVTRPFDNRAIKFAVALLAMILAAVLSQLLFSLASLVMR
jgi:hypothetical protein